MSRIDWWAVSDESVHPVSCTQQYTIEALAEKNLCYKKNHTEVTWWSLVMAPDVMEVHTATIFRIQVGVLSVPLAL
jgi:hypothetical protein